MDDNQVTKFSFENYMTVKEVFDLRKQGRIEEARQQRLLTLYGCHLSYYG